MCSSLWKKSLSDFLGKHFFICGFVHLPCSAEEKQLRLLGGHSSHEGVIEIWLESEWGILCDVDWGFEEVDVACRQLGRSTGLVISTVDVDDQLGGRTFTRRYACEGYEASLNECAWSADDVPCQPQDVVQISCGPIRGRVCWLVDSKTIFLCCFN